jgi:stage II sporulation protein AA (anti-sigma F factor antagonist)
MMVDVRGELDSTSTTILRDGLAGHVMATKPPRVVIDLGSVTSMDNTVLSELLRVQRNARSVGASLRVANPSPPVARLLEAARVAEALGYRPGNR